MTSAEEFRLILQNYNNTLHYSAIFTTKGTVMKSILVSTFQGPFDPVKLIALLNGNVKRFAKPLKGYIEAASPHFEFWRNAKQVLNTMYFVDSNNKKRVSPTIKNGIVTLNGMVQIFKGLP
ncbi:hypothetical protein Trydic_g11172 [Trypoxylus dichotomus]